MSVLKDEFKINDSTNKTYVEVRKVENGVVTYDEYTSDKYGYSVQMGIKQTDKQFFEDHEDFQPSSLTELKRFVDSFKHDRFEEFDYVEATWLDDVLDILSQTEQSEVSWVHYRPKKDSFDVDVDFESDLTDEMFDYFDVIEPYLEDLFGINKTVTIKDDGNYTVTDYTPVYTH